MISFIEKQPHIKYLALIIREKIEVLDSESLNLLKKIRNLTLFNFTMGITAQKLI